MLLPLLALLLANIDKVFGLFRLPTQEFTHGDSLLRRAHQTQ